MWRLKWILGVTLFAMPLQANAQLAAPGLGLNRPDLQDNYWYPSYPLGFPMAVKGAPSLFGFFRGGVWPNVDTGSAKITTPRWWTSIDGPVSLASPSLSQTLVPPHASGAVRGTTASAPGIVAMLFEPDQLKRKQSKKGNTTQMKQKNFVGFQFLDVTSLGYDYESPFTAEGCQAQVKIEVDPEWGGGRGRMKVKCANKSAEAAAVLERLDMLWGKKRTGFDLDQKWGDAR